MRALSIFGGLVVFGALILGACWAIPHFGTAKRAAAYSCAASLHSVLTTEKTLTLSIDNHAQMDWKLLSDAEYDGIVNEALRRRLLDVGSERATDGQTVIDPWKQRFKVAIRKQTHGETEYVVWSRGPDAVSGTADDVVSPRRAKVPFRDSAE